jgi:prepilin-type N-terminal cleavage/methylation domain-containing protein
MSDRTRRGFTLMEIAITLALGVLVMGLVGSLFVASLSAWRRGSDLREAQVQAGTLVDVIARDVRGASQAPSVTIRPQVSTEDGDPLLSVYLTGRLGAGTEPAWVLYLRQPDRQEVLRQTVEAGPGGSAVVRQSRVVATGVEEVRIEQTGGAVTIEVVVRRGRERATGRVTAAPQNP